jgi:hypothetical protein
MQYILLIYTNEAEVAARPPDVKQAVTNEYVQFMKETQAAGSWLGGDRLTSVANATCVRVREGKVLKTDGPFAETREQLAGYIVVEAKNLDEATALAAKIPGARFGTIEVRPIMGLPTVQ